MKTNFKDNIKKIIVEQNNTILQTMKVINEGGFGTALMVDSKNEMFIGLVTDGDIRRAILNGCKLESKISDVSHPKTKVGYVGMSHEELSSLFTENIRLIPILDDSNHVVDIAIFDKRIYLPVSEPSLDEKELLYVSECILTNWISSKGKFVTQFEDMFSKFCGTKYAVSTTSGTTALHLALLALDIKEGDEVILPSLTFIATANVVKHCGATPVFVDSEIETWNIDPYLIEQAITSKTKAIIPVHIYGHPADMDPILSIAKKYNLYVIEDSAEAHGALYKGKKVGSMGHLGAFSFYGNKVITTGEGGMVITDSEELYNKMQILKSHGMDPEIKYLHPVLGYNYRLTNIQAAIGVAQMEKIDTLIEKKRKISGWYKEGLTGIKGITLPPEKKWAKNVYWMYSILINEAITGISRDELMNKLTELGIETRPFFYPVHKQPIYNSKQILPVAEKLSREGINLPSAVNLDENKVRNVVKEIKRILNS
jgi:perosamine synthetase